MWNQLFLENGNYDNFKIIDTLYNEGIRMISPGMLSLRGFNFNVTALQGVLNGKIVLVYNDYSIEREEVYIKIQKNSKLKN